MISFEAYFTISGNLSQVLENTMERPEAKKNSAFLLLSKDEIEKT